MRKITRQLVLLFVVFVIYFGYSAFIDGAALFHISSSILIQPVTGDPFTLAKGIQIGSADWANAKIIFENGIFSLPAGWTATISGSPINLNDYVTGFMAPNSLLYTILTPFKLVLVGAVFAMLVPLTKSIFFGTIIGIKNYMKARRSNILFNYQTTINFVVDMNSKLSLGDYEQIKAQYATYVGLKFKPMFLQNMMDEIGDSLIRELDMRPFIKPSQAIIVSLKEMYEKERKTAISMKPDEMFFDFKRGYEYISIGSKYCIAYYKALETNTDTQMKLAWKLFSLEMFRFYVYMLMAIIPTVILNVIALPIIGNVGSSAAASKAAPALIIVSFFIFSIIFHAIFTLTKSSYRNMLRSMVVPAITYYLLMLILAGTFAVGVNGIISIGTIVSPGTAVAKMWPFFAALGYTILSTCLILYIISTLMDSNKNPLGMTRKVIVDGVILPIIAWVASTGINFAGVLSSNLDMSVWSGVSFAILCAFWIYLSISGVLLNNIVIPSRKKKVEIQNALAAEGKEAEKKSKSDSSSKDKN